MVSVIIPTYERYDLLLRAIDSVVAQTYTEIEIIVVDDPPHPISNVYLWGSLKGIHYSNIKATAPMAIPLMDIFYKKIINEGFKIIKEK